MGASKPTLRELLDELERVRRREGAHREAHFTRMQKRCTDLLHRLPLVHGLNQSSDLSAVLAQEALLSRTQRGLQQLGVLGSGLLFTAVYEQSGQSLLLWARDCTRHALLGYSFPPSSLLGLPGLLVLGIQPLLSRTQSALSRRGHRPSPISRIGIGLLFGVVAYLIMVIAALRQERSRALATPAWLVACFTALTVAELLVYPLGMSLVTRLAPQFATAVAMGLWLVSLAGGHWLAGEVASHWAMWSHATLFAVLAALALAAVVVLALASRPIRRATKGMDHADKA